MTRIAIDLNDAGLVIAAGDKVIDAGPACVVEADGALRLGAAAAARARLEPRRVQRRYWLEMSDAPLPAPLAGCASGADLAQRQLAALAAHCDGAEGVTLAVMPQWSAAQLGLLLGLAREAGLPVTGLVDPAVAASRRPWPGRALWDLQLSLHAATLSRIEQGAGALLAERVGVERIGFEALERGCAEFLARRFVACSRFDPLHDARSEQDLVSRLPEWLPAAARQERVPVALEHGGHRFEAWFEAADLKSHAARLVEPLVQKLRSLTSPREPAVLQVQGRLADFPGVVEALARLPGCAVVLLEPAAVARGALRVPPGGDAAAGVSLTVQLPFDQPAGTVAAGGVESTASTPTHVVFEGRAWRLGARAFLIGTDPGEGEYGLRLDAQLQAVSRRHCSIRLEDGRAVVADLSRYGTWLNGHRIEGSAVLQPGDVLAVGRPAREFALIAEVGDAP